MTNKFVHFRSQSSYSMLESCIKIKKLIDLTHKHSMNAICLTDRGNLFGSLEFAQEAIKSKIQPIHGAILNIAFVNNNKIDFAEILLIAKDPIGYKNLLQLVSLTFTKNDRSTCNHITFEDLTKYNDGIIVLSAYASGIIGKFLLLDDVDAAKDTTLKFKKLFGNRFYFEITRSGSAQEKQIENNYIKLANECLIPLIATNPVLFSDISMYDAHDVLLCISQGVVQNVQDRKRVSNQCYFKSSEEMIELFYDIPESIENTVYLAQRCYVMAEPHPPSLPKFSDNLLETDLIKKFSQDGLDKKLSQKFSKEKITEKDQIKLKQEYFNRLNYELDIICKMNFAGYFLIVSDFIKWAKKNNISVGPGRGSGAGSIIAWVLDITDLDPIKFGLLFERFLNPERISMPDFDIDICQERRAEVITYVRSKYGAERVAQIITFGKLQPKAAIKDVSRVLALPYKIADDLTELIPFNAVNPVTLEQAIAEVPELKNASKGMGLGFGNIEHDSEINELIQQVISTSLTLEGMHRHASTHAAGIVISNDVLTKTVPICKDQNSEMLIVQYSMKYSEMAGLVKFDFLGLQTLTVITKTIKLIKESGSDIDINQIPFNDSHTFKMLSRGLSTGVFQFESIGMKHALCRLIPDNIDDIIALGALYRPGPMDNIPTYIACKHGKQKVDYLHPLLEPILRTTHGVIIYQEQVMEIARVLSGYSLGAADLLRRAMGKKVKSEMDQQEGIFVNGAVKNKVAIEQAKSIFKTVAKFAGYGFNKSHASAYGVISYQTAYLKANFTIEFLVASLNLEIDNSDKINIFLQDAKNFNIQIINPDINKSEGKFVISYADTKKFIIFAIGAIKNVTSNLGDHITNERRKNGPFKSITDFAERIPPKLLNKRSLENIIKAGIFDSLHPNRNSLINSVPKIIAYCLAHHTEQKSTQFSLIPLNSINSNILIDAKKLTISEMADFEFEVMGLFLDNHPLTKNIQSLSKANIKNSTYLKNELHEGSQFVKLAGVIIKKNSRMSKRGRFITLTISDPFGIFEVSIFNENTLRDYSHLTNVKDKVVISCDIYKENNIVRISAEQINAVEDELQKTQHDFRLYPKNQRDIENILHLLKQKKTDKKANSKITLFIPVNKIFLAKIIMSDRFLFDENDIIMLEKFTIVKALELA